MSLWTLGESAVSTRNTLRSGLRRDRTLRGIRSQRRLRRRVDNRQDASLQAGHFNDFVQVTKLRGALYRALEKTPEGLTDEIVAQQVTDELGLAMADFARNRARSTASGTRRGGRCAR